MFRMRQSRFLPLGNRRERLFFKWPAENDCAPKNWITTFKEYHLFTLINFCNISWCILIISSHWWICTDIRWIQICPWSRLWIAIFTFDVAWAKIAAVTATKCAEFTSLPENRLIGRIFYSELCTVPHLEISLYNVNRWSNDCFGQPCKSLHLIQFQVWNCCNVIVS